ncbi:DNA-directed RNA polymerase, subunit F [Archaeoglobus sulfaticallidus PM70-1]|uniref:DNA-directed RNA polymerase subunit Rpo4 n=1 Tax=Archaeoglobus sulfaticallidus PM70-1 TaxID=387631 RepID=N0BAG6_9EURY|nr:RNA polymerase Rpb4 family protein [Archaeoglobus sulfaticallidus]AGK60594.1 DNA-directed RNA polymerase, subunit F [Archaeoglobus sulfaticallidus PM70-1]
MTFKEVIEFEYITISEAREIMENIAKKRQEKAELLFETRRALKNLRSFSKLPVDKAKELVNELEGLSFISRKDLAVKIADIMPRIPDEVRTIFAKERFTLTPEQIKEILDTVDRYR